MVKEDSLKKRYFSKLIANLIGVPISIITQSIIPRGLGPSAYGDFSFLTNFFTQVVGFLDTGTSIGFYTKLSRRLNEGTLIKFYWYFILFVSCILILFLPILFIFNKENFIWPNQSFQYIWLALLFGLLQWDSQIIGKIVDAYGLTVQGEIVRITQKFLGLILILTLFFIGKLNLLNFFFYYYIIIFFLCVGWWYVLRKNGIQLFPKVKLELTLLKNYIIEFYHYSHPLFVRAIFTLVFGLFSFWLLQKVAGSIQQGYYGLAYKIAGISFLFAGSLIPLFTREFSIAFGKKDIAKMQNLFTKLIPLIYFVVAFLAVFISINADTVSVLIGGEKFYGAKIAVAIMAFYPIHQVYGQLTGSVYYATEQTKKYRNISFFMMFIGFPLTYFLIAPAKFYGLDLQAVGMALSGVLSQFIGVNILHYYNTKYLKLSFLKCLYHQILSIFLLGIISFGALFLSKLINVSIFISFIINGFIYLFFSIVLVYSIPWLIAYKREELKKVIIEFVGRIMLKKNKS